MARYWNRVSDPNKPVSRSHRQMPLPTTIMVTQFGQRPMFSVPGPDQPPPDVGRIGTEARLDDIYPTDQSDGSQYRESLENPKGIVPVFLTHSKKDVSTTITEDECLEAFGAKQTGFIALVIDNGGAGQVHLVVKSKADLWWFEKMTKAT